MADNWSLGILLDTETSGTDPKIHQLLTLDAVVIRCNGLLWEATGAPFHGQLERQPSAVWDRTALAVNHIDAATWSGSSAATLMSDLFRWVKATAGASYNLTFGYNLTFDLDFIRPLVDRAGLRWTDAFSYRRLDVLQLVHWSRLQGRLKVPDDSMKLAHVAAALGIDAGDAHNSAADVQITLQVMNRLLTNAAQGSLFD